jgi:uncharacterized protein DUF3386
MNHLQPRLILLAGVLIALTAGSPRAQDVQADPKARELMREVYEKRESWGSDFPGFQAKAVVVYKGQEHRGTVQVGKDYRVEVEIPNEGASKWATDALQSIVLHRRGGRFEEGDGRYPVTFGPTDEHPAGRLIRLNDQMNSTYRVKDGQILQINRAAGPRMRFTIDIIENIRTDRGKVLPRLFTVSYFRSDSGELERTETFWDGYKKVGDYYLPEFRRQITAEDGSTSSMSLRLEQIKLQ